MSKIVGIDLGTTYSAIAVIGDTGKPEIKAPKEDGIGNLFPSYVLLEEDGTLKVGETARKQAGIPEDGAEVVGYRFKRFMGTQKTFAIRDKNFTPTELSAAVLKKIKQDFEAQNGKISEAVITIPANFANEAREATLEAAKIAGLNVNYIINEPTAAALYYVHKMAKEGTLLQGKYAIYDLGGGTFDITIAKIEGQEVEVLATSGIHELGGIDFDEEFRKLVFKKYESKSGEQADEEDFDLYDADSNKRSLSTRDKCRPKCVRPVDVSRTEFEERISGRIAQTVMECENALDEAKCGVDEIQEILLVGGSTRIPAIHESIKKVFGKEPIGTANVDESVALGAAIYAGMKCDQSLLTDVQKSSLKKVVLQEITAKFFGTSAVVLNEAKGEKEIQNTTIIRRGERIPCSKTETYHTGHEGQTTVRCDVLESANEETDLKFTKKLAEVKLSLPPGRPANQPIEVTFSYDENQTMHCSFKDVETGEMKKVTVHIKGKDSIEDFVVE